MQQNKTKKTQLILNLMEGSTYISISFKERKISATPVLGKATNLNSSLILQFILTQLPQPLLQTI